MDNISENIMQCTTQYIRQDIRKHIRRCNRQTYQRRRMPVSFFACVAKHHAVTGCRHTGVNSAGPPVLCSLFYTLPDVNGGVAFRQNKACCFLPLQDGSRRWWQQLSRTRAHHPWTPHPALGGARVEGLLPKALLRALLSEAAPHAQVAWLPLVTLF